MLPKLMASAWDDSTIQVPFNWKVFTFTAFITIGTGVVFGIFPAPVATRAEIGAALKQGAQSSSRRRKSWSGKGIVAFQVALSTLLVIAAALFLRTLINLNAIDPGFRTNHLILFDISAPDLRYPSPKDVALHMRLEEALRAVQVLRECHQQRSLLLEARCGTALCMSMARRNRRTPGATGTSTFFYLTWAMTL